MLRVILRINQVHLVRDLAGLVKNKTKDGLSDGSIIFNNVKNPIKQTIIKIDGAPGVDLTKGHCPTEELEAPKYKLLQPYHCVSSRARGSLWFSVWFTVKQAIHCSL